MFCPLYKWKISQALDSGKTISSNVYKHLQRCDTCREYAELCSSLKQKFTLDKKVILQDFDEVLNEKIMAAIPEKPELGTEPGRSSRTPKWPFGRPALIPSLAAALTVLAFAISLLFFIHLQTKQASSPGQISALIRATSPEDVLSKVESPLEKEYAELKRTLESTGKFLVSSLDFRIGPQAK